MEEALLLPDRERVHADRVGTVEGWTARNVVLCWMLRASFSQSLRPGQEV